MQDLKGFKWGRMQRVETTQSLFHRAAGETCGRLRRGGADLWRLATCERSRYCHQRRRTGDHLLGESGQPRHMNAVAMIRHPGEDLVEERDVSTVVTDA